MKTIFSVVALAGILASALLAEEDAGGGVANSGQELAKKLSNPISSLISVPLQFNYDSGYGPTDGNRLLLNIQPVIPVPLNKDWNLISRTILPVTNQNHIAGNSGSQFGLGDVVQSFFFSPSRPTKGGLIWGVGPVLMLPTGSGQMLSAKKWGAGPTGVVLKQKGPVTMGLLTNHIWSYAGADYRSDVSATYLQPFVTYTTPKLMTYGLNTESTYDWKSSKWSVPINLSVAKLTKFGSQRVQIGAGLRYWATSPDNGPDGLGFRMFVTYLFPTK